MIKRKAIFFIVFIAYFIPYFVYSQYNYEQKRDSIFNYVNHIVNGKEDLIIRHSYKYIPNNLQRFSKSFYNEYQANNFEELSIDKLNYLLGLAIVHQQIDMLKECIEEYKGVLVLIERYPNRRVKLFVNIKIANAYRLKSNYRLALDNYYQCLDNPFIADSTDIPKWRLLSVIAESHEIIGDEVEAMEACLKLQVLYREDSMLAEGSYNLIQLGRIASHLESDTFYFEYYHRAVEMAYQSGYKPRIANNLVNLAIAYRLEGYPQKALKYYHEAKFYNEFSRPFPQAYYYLHLAETYFSLNRIEESIFNARISYSLAKKIDASGMESSACSTISRCYTILHENDSALYYLQKALNYQSKTYFAHNSSSYRLMSDLKVQMNDYKAAFIYLDSSFVIYKEEIEKENTQKLVQLREKSDYYIHRARISDLVIDNQKEQEKSKRILIITLAISLILALTIYFIIIIRKRHTQLKNSYINLVEKNIALDKLYKRVNDCEMKNAFNSDTENLKDEERILKNLKKLLIKGKVYTNPNISLPSLAKSLKTNTSYLSAVINSHYSCNFRSLINGYRITKAKEMLVNDDFANYSIEGIANEVGYNSRSSFYNAFKVETGLTPALFLENYKLIEKGRSKDSELDLL